MNNFQKIGVFVARVFALILFATGLMGIFYAGSQILEHVSPDDFPIPRLCSGVIFCLAAVVIWSLSKPIGRLLGRGLD